MWWMLKCRRCMNDYVENVLDGPYAKQGGSENKLDN